MNKYSRKDRGTGLVTHSFMSDFPPSQEQIAEWDRWGPWDLIVQDLSAQIAERLKNEAERVLRRRRLATLVSQIKAGDDKIDVKAVLPDLVVECCEHF